MSFFGLPPTCHQMVLIRHQMVMVQIFSLQVPVLPPNGPDLARNLQLNLYFLASWHNLFSNLITLVSWPGFSNSGRRKPLAGREKPAWV